MPDKTDNVVLPNRINELRLFVELHHSDILGAVRFVCLQHHQSEQDIVEELCEQVIVLLLEDNCRRLLLFDPQKGSFRSWLKTVVEHHISHYLQRQKKPDCLDDVPPEALLYQPTQETALIIAEHRAMLRAAMQAQPSRPATRKSVAGWSFGCRDCQ